MIKDYLWENLTDEQKYVIKAQLLEDEAYKSIKLQEVKMAEEEKIPDKKPKRFSDVYGQATFDFLGEQVEEKTIRDKEITIYDFAILNGQFGEFAVIDAELSEEINITNEEGSKSVKRVQFAEGSDIIRKQLKKAKEDKNLPIIAKIVEKTAEKSKMAYRTLA